MSVDKFVRDIIAECTQVSLDRIIQQGQNNGKASPDDGNPFITFRLSNDVIDPHQYSEHISRNEIGEDETLQEVIEERIKGHDRFTYSITIYGKNAMSLFRMMNAKIRTQNVINIFHGNAMGFIGFGTVSQLNELVGNKYLYRIDFEMYFNSEITHSFDGEILTKDFIQINGHFDRS